MINCGYAFGYSDKFEVVGDYDTNAKVVMIMMTSKMVNMVVAVIKTSLQSLLRMIMEVSFMRTMSLKMMNVAVRIDYEINYGRADDGEFAELIKE